MTEKIAASPAQFSTSSSFLGRPDDIYTQKKALGVSYTGHQKREQSMINISSFFNQLASQYAARYHSLASRFTPQTQHTSLSPQAPQAPQATQATQATRVPQAQLGSPIVETEHKPQNHSGSKLAQSGLSRRSDAPTTTKSREPEDRLEISNPRAKEIEKEDHDHENKPSVNGATYEREFSQLRYGLDLNFNAQALQRTIHQLSAIQTEDATSVSETFESFSSLNIGLGVNFQIEGLQVTERAELSGPEGAEKAGRYLRQATGDKFENLLKQASRTNENLPSANRYNYQLAVNQFALRYSSDAQFSFTHFSRFNSQVAAVGEASPEELNGLTSSAGELAEFASNDVMDSFLDSVDAYLEDSEENLLEKIDEFFNMAGSELGLSSDAIAQAKEQLSSTVENFFDKVESSISAIKDQVFGEPAPSAESQIVNQIQPGGDQPVLDKELIIDPNLEFLEAMLDALDTLEEEPIDSSDLINPDGLTLKDPEEALAGALG